MLGRIVEIAEDHRHLSLYRGFMLVHQTGASRAELARIPLDDIAAVIANSFGLSYSNNLLVALAERGIPLALCGSDHNVAGMLLTVDGHCVQAKRIDAQLQATQAQTRRLWADIVRAKLQAQAWALHTVGANPVPITALIRKVRNGDPENIEAQGARRYWVSLFGPAFRRDRSAEGINQLLNYGYTVLRATTARAVIAAGLHPTPSLHHLNEGNPLRLVDDLMEPFRPVVDIAVWRLHAQQQIAVCPETKRVLAHAMYEDLQTSAGNSPVMVCTQRLATSVAQVFSGERKKLDLPYFRLTSLASVVKEEFC